MKVVCIVQARMGSMRLPGKVLLGIQGKPLLWHVLNRASQIGGVDQVVLAIPTRDERMLTHLWPHVCVGTERNVTHRYVQAAEQFKADVIVRVTGDCPLFAPDIATQILKQFLAQPNTYMPGCQPYVPNADGFDVEVFSSHALIGAYVSATTDEDREHVTTVMRASVNKRMPDWLWGNLAHLKLSVDTMLDYQRVAKVMDMVAGEAVSARSTIDAWEKAGRP